MTNKISNNNIEDSSWIDNIGHSEKSVQPLKSPVCIAQNVTEQTISNECERIESIASNNGTYNVNGTWKEEDKSYLKEYARACGLSRDQIVEVSAEQIKATAQSIQERKASEKQSIVKTASKEETIMQDELSKVMVDPFKLDEKLSAERPTDDWEKITYSKNLGDKPSMKGIKAIRGGENYNENHSHKIGVNQNSILDPNRIDRLTEAENLDNGEKIRQEKARIKKESIDVQTQEREKALKEAESDLAITSKGKVFPTESLSAQSGIHGGMGGKLLDLDSIPDQTQGEAIVLANNDRRNSIQRPVKEDRSWEKIDNNVRTISDDFGEELSKLLNK